MSFPSVEQAEPTEETHNRHHRESVPDHAQNCYVREEKIGRDSQTEAEVLM